MLFWGTWKVFQKLSQERFCIRICKRLHCMAIVRIYSISMSMFKLALQDKPKHSLLIRDRGSWLFHVVNTVSSVDHTLTNTSGWRSRRASIFTIAELTLAAATGTRINANSLRLMEKVAPIVAFWSRTSFTMEKTRIMVRMLSTSLLDVWLRRRTCSILSKQMASLGSQKETVLTHSWSQFLKKWKRNR